MAADNTPATPDPKDVLIQTLQERLAALEAHVGMPADAVPAGGGRFPTTLYKRGHKKGQIDHPGNLTKIVGSQDEIDQWKADGWQETPLPYLDLDEAEELARESVKSKKTGKKAA